MTSTTMVSCFFLASAAAWAGGVAAPTRAADGPQGKQAPASGQSGGGTKAKAAAMVDFQEEAITPESAPPMPIGEERLEVGERIRQRTPAFQECYARRLEVQPTLQGRLMTHFDIGPSGKVIGATAEGIEDTELIACVLTVIRKMEFNKPASGGKLRVTYPWNFTPEPRK